MKRLRDFEDWVFNSYSTTTTDLSIFRMLYATCMLLTHVPIADHVRFMPTAFFNPPVSIAAFTTALPPYQLVVTLNILLAASLAILFVGWKTPFASIATGLLLIVLNSWNYSTGKINHDIFAVLLPLIFAYSGWGDANSLDYWSARNEPDRRTALTKPFPSTSAAFMALIVGFGMFTAGFAKIISGWLNPHASATYGHLISNATAFGRTPPIASWTMTIHSPLLWEFSDWIVTLMEVFFIIAMFQKRWIIVMTAAAATFHFATWLLFDILFSVNVVSYGAFISFSSQTMLTNIINHLARSRRQLWTECVLLFSLGLIATGRHNTIDFTTASTARIIIVTAGAITGLVYLSQKTITFFRPNRSIQHRISTS